MNTNEVSEAFEILLEEIEAVIDTIRNADAEALLAGHYGKGAALLGGADGGA